MVSKTQCDSFLWRQQSYGDERVTFNMELKLTTPRGLYIIALGLTVLVEIVLGAIEVAMYFGLI